MKFSILIISIKKDIITLNDPYVEKFASEIIIDSSPGISSARNKLAEKAQSEILVFLDDDIEVDKAIWDQIAQIQSHEVLMAQGYSHPITRVMAIKKGTFQKIGGFDENIRYNGEDLDFYWRALKKGYTVGIIPSCYIYHKPHRKSNWVKYHFESAYTRIKHGRISIDFFFRPNPMIALLHVAGFIYYNFRSMKN